MKYVKSKFRASWTGVVIDIQKRRNRLNPLYTCVIIKDSNGNTPRKRIIRILDSSWLVEVEQFDISHINKDWLKL